MKKTILISVVIALVLTSCGTKSEPKSTDPTGTQPPASQPKTDTKPQTDDKKNEPKETKTPRTITVTSGNLFFRPSTITVKANEQVTLNFQNSGFHTFTVPALGIDVDLRGKSSGTVTFTATQKGTFPFKCTVPGHAESGMVGTLIVE